MPHGVKYGVLAAVSIYGTYNDYTIRSLRKYPRLRGTVNLDPAQTDLYQMERMAADGIVGVRLQLARRKELPDLTDDAHRLLFRRIRDLNWHVHLAMEAHWIAHVLPALEASGVRVVFDHFGHPDPDKGLECEGFNALLRSIEKGRTWVKLSGGVSAHVAIGWRRVTGSEGDESRAEGREAIAGSRRHRAAAVGQRLSVRRARARGEVSGHDRCVSRVGSFHRRSAADRACPGRSRPSWPTSWCPRSGARALPGPRGLFAASVTARIGELAYRHRAPGQAAALEQRLPRAYSDFNSRDPSGTTK